MKGQTISVPSVSSVPLPGSVLAVKSGCSALHSLRCSRRGASADGSESIMIVYASVRSYSLDTLMRADCDADNKLHDSSLVKPDGLSTTESAPHAISGKLADGSPFETSIRVTKPHALVMLKLLALDDRYRNTRGLAEARHDREEARIHAADIVAIVSVQPDADKFKTDFQKVSGGC